MFGTIKTIILENIWWRNQIRHLAIVELQKTIRGTVLGWLWLFIKPIMYIAVFWFALEVGLRADRIIGNYPFIIWLAIGIISWFYMQDAIGVGSNLYKRYSYLINRVSFPPSVIPSFYNFSNLIVFSISMIVLIALMAVFGETPSIHALQVPILALMMFVFFILFSLMTSPIAAISKDFANLTKALTMPVFWVSGVIFSIDSIDIPWLKWVFAFNPVSFFVTAYRDALLGHTWVWERPDILPIFGLVLLFTFVMALQVHRRLGWEVADVL